jgi:hypothetical protein
VEHLELDPFQRAQAAELAPVVCGIGDSQGSAPDHDHAALLVDVLQDADSIIESWSGPGRLLR